MHQTPKLIDILNESLYEGNVYIQKVLASLKNKQTLS